LKTSLCSHVSTLLNYDKDASSSACEFLVNVFVEEGSTKKRERERERESEADEHETHCHCSDSFILYVFYIYKFRKKILATLKI